MRDHAIVSPRFWTGRTGMFLRTHPEAQRLALYLMTCPNSNMTGLYYLPMPTICHEMQMTPEEAAGALNKVSAAGFAEYDRDTETVFVSEMARFQLGEKMSAGDKRVRSTKKMVLQFRNSPFFSRFVAKYGKIFNLDLEAPSESQEPTMEGASGSGRLDQETDTDQETDKGASPVGPSDDPMKTEERNRKAFESAWNAAGLMPLKRLTHALHTRLAGLMRDPDWRAIWQDALVRAGQSPFLAKGAGRQQGPLDPSEFLRDDDFAASVLRGKFDPRTRDGPVQPIAPTVFVDPDNLPTNKLAPPPKKDRAE